MREPLGFATQCVILSYRNFSARRKRALVSPSPCYIKNLRIEGISVVKGGLEWGLVGYDRVVCGGCLSTLNKILTHFIY